MPHINYCLFSLGSPFTKCNYLQIYLILRRFSNVKLWKFSKSLNIDIMLYYTCKQCPLTLCASMRWKNVWKKLNFAL